MTPTYGREPWTWTETSVGGTFRVRHYRYIEDADGYVITKVSGSAQSAHLDRLIACVNACAGLDPIPPDLAAVVAERDALFGALATIIGIGHNDDCMFCGFKDKYAAEAIKNMKDEEAPR